MNEAALQQQLFQKNEERSYVDKILGRKDVSEMRELMKKEKLTRGEIMDLLYLLSSVESKVYNFERWERYVIEKYFIWIRDFVKIIEQLYDYIGDLDKKQKSGKLKLSDESKALLENCERKIQHDAKFLVDLYLNICRTSLSVDGKAFQELLTSRAEIVYPNMPPAAAMQMQAQQAAQPQRRGLFR
jgi:hypothetical protein